MSNDAGRIRMVPYEDQAPVEEYPEHQLIPQKGGRYITVFHGPPGTDVGDLHCDLEAKAQGEQGYVINHSGWRPTEEQIAQLESGAHVRLSLWIHPIPPIAVSIEPPVCACHGDDMVFDRDECGYYCAHLDTAGRQASNRHNPQSALEQAKADFTPEEAPSDEAD